MIIFEKTIYIIDNREFNSQEEAYEYCEQKLAEALCNLVAATLSPKEKLNTFDRVHKLSFEERKKFADLFIVRTEKV